MPRLSKLLIAVLLGSALGSGLAGCSGKAVEEADPATLFKEAEDEVKNDHFQIAIDKYRVIKNKYPYSKYAIDAQVRIADVYFLEDSYPEAAASYEAFVDLHPKHEKVAYAMFRIGKSYFNDIPDPIARDLTPATKALNAYNQYLSRFPAGENAVEVKADVAKIRTTLADKELYIADFYFKRQFPDSAAPRYRKILDLYPDTDAAAKAKEKLAKIAELPPRKTESDPVH